MNRLIKFRAWDSLNSKMFSHEDILRMKFDVTFDEIEKNISMPLIQFLLLYQDESQSQLELMQFIGLLDPNGKEIYEGDLFQVANNKIYQVKFMTGGEFNFEWYGGTFVLWFDEELFFPFDEFAMKNGKIVGNIYENPELLNNGKD